MAKADLPPQELLRQLLHYEAKTGKLYWLERPQTMFASAGAANAWNAKNAGSEAFTSLCNYGYRQGRVLGRNYRAHIVIWVLVHGSPPVGVVDHINHDKADNRQANLRVITKADNHRNMSLRAGNRSGMMGVKRFRKKWQAFITIDGVTVHLGTFDNFEDAAAARAEANERYGFHPNHGT